MQATRGEMGFGAGTGFPAATSRAHISSPNSSLDAPEHLRSRQSSEAGVQGMARETRDNSSGLPVVLDCQART